MEPEKTQDCQSNPEQKEQYLLRGIAILEFKIIIEVW